jgi:hypothetical protein
MPFSANMKFLQYILSFFILSGLARAQDTGYYKLTKLKSSTNEKTTTVGLNFKFEGPDLKPVRSHVKFLVNRDTIVPKMDVNGSYDLKVKPGKYKILFFTPGWYDVGTDSIDVKLNHPLSFFVHFEAKEMKFPGIQYDLGKPVIYLYPTQKTDIRIKLNFKGQLTFTYPEYKNEWKCTATPDGNLSCQGKNLNYLFWEGKTTAEATIVNWKEGFIVETDSLVSFFERQLATIGLNDEESADFITYWVPKMRTNKSNYVHFMFAEEYARLATLDVQPVPDNQIRLFVVWGDPESIQTTDIQPQRIIPLARKGFTLVEWGAGEMNNLFNLVKP